jgi:hypothetical protein
MFNKMIFLTSILVFATGMTSLGQKIKGYVFEMNEAQEKLPLPGANIFWAGTAQGTASNEEGWLP